MRLFAWPPTKRSCSLKVFVPLSTVSIKQSQLLKTILIWEIARAIAITRCSHLILYKDPESKKDEDRTLVEKVLRYLLTPPYLRKKVIPLDPQLRYVGMLSPMALPIHYKKNEPVLGSVRLAVLAKKGNTIVALIGIDKPCKLVNANVSDIKLNETPSLHFVKVLSLNPPLCSLIDEDSISVYTGFKYHYYSSLEDALMNECKESVIIEFSKHGKDVNELRQNLLEAVSHNKNILCAIFGSPCMDASEILLKERGYGIASLANTELHARYLAVNAVPHQGVRSIRTHEALYLALAVLNHILYELNICL